MHILITDSGVGGLSVVASAERFVRTRGFTEPVRLTFADAAPALDYGYNSMPSHEEKLETFDRFLRNVTDRFAPDAIYVACNTLSVLLPETGYFSRATIPVKGIVRAGVELLGKELEEDPQNVAIIFGTQTTVDAKTYPLLLVGRGLDPARIICQACPDLADIIADDGEGTTAFSEIRRWVRIAVDKLPRRSAPVVACLACTHYGYRRDFFAACLDDADVRAKVIDPNECAVDELFPNGGDDHDVQVSFVTRYAVPGTTIGTLTSFLSDVSPRTVHAMQNFVLLPDLF